jgi:general secretion pathway protein D
MKFLLLLFISLNAQAALKLENGFILPFKLKEYPLKSLVNDYAEMMNSTISFPSSMFRENEKLNLEINSRMTKDELQTIVFHLLSNRGYTPIEQNGILWIHSSRDIRYTPSPLTTDLNFPADSRFRTAVFRLKYPISSILARNLRPAMSRYGRVIDLSDARTLIINDTSDNLKRMQKTIEFMDVEATFKNFVNDIPKKDPNAFDPTNEKIVELEAEKKILEKKYIEIKENSGTGISETGIPTWKN